MAQPDAALLQDLCSRFILNVPAEELRCVYRRFEFDCKISLLKPQPQPQLQTSSQNELTSGCKIAPLQRPICTEVAS